MRPALPQAMLNFHKPQSLKNPLPLSTAKPLQKNKMTLPPFVVFDLDGTLVDTAADLAAAVNQCLDIVGQPRLTPAQVRQFVGHGARVLIKRALEASGPATDAAIEQLMPHFSRHYSKHIADYSRPYEGVRTTLETLAEDGCRLGVCTNKPERLSVDLLEALGLRRFFGTIVGGDTLQVRKPDPAPLRATMERLGGNPQRSVMVGDSRVDIETARAAGVPIVAVAFGFSSEPVASLGSTVSVDNFGQMLDALHMAHASRSN